MILNMRGLDLIAVLLLLQSWRRLGNNSMATAAHHSKGNVGSDRGNDSGDESLSTSHDESMEDFDLALSLPPWSQVEHINAIRHKIFPQLQ